MSFNVSEFSDNIQRITIMFVMVFVMVFKNDHNDLQKY